MSKYIKHKDKILSLFSCQNSGNCCRYPGVVYVKDHDIDKMSSILGMTSFDFRQRYVHKQNGWHVISSSRFRPLCFLNEASQCDVYNGRPRACKTYPNWESIWSSDDSFLSEVEQCPGLKKAFETYLEHE